MRRLAAIERTEDVRILFAVESGSRAWGFHSPDSEWLASPHIYICREPFAAALNPVASAWRSAYADAHHYYGLLATQRGRFIAGRDEVNLKKHFYAVRPAIALHWLREREDPPPMDLPGLLGGVKLPTRVFAALERLREAKRRATELGTGPPIAELDEYIEEQAAWGLEAKGRMPRPDPALVERSNKLFRAAVRGALG